MIIAARKTPDLPVASPSTTQQPRPARPAPLTNLYVMPDSMKHVADGSVRLPIAKHAVAEHQSTAGLASEHPLMDRSHYCTTQLFPAEAVATRQPGWQAFVYNDDETFE